MLFWFIVDFRAFLLGQLQSPFYLKTILSEAQTLYECINEYIDGILWTSGVGIKGNDLEI